MAPAIWPPVSRRSRRTRTRVRSGKSSWPTTAPRTARRTSRGHSASGSSRSRVAAGAPYRSPAHATWVQLMYDAMREHPSEPATTRWLGSGNLVVRRAAFDAVGGFDSQLEACEDVDLCRKLRLRGGTLVSTPGMTSVHLGDPPTLGALFRGELWR